MTDLHLLTNLVTLNAFSAGLTGTLDVHGIASLTNLDCNTNPSMTGLTLTNCTGLAICDCRDCGIITLDAHTCTAMVNLNCQFTLFSPGPLTSLDVSGLVNMTDLACANQDLTSLDVHTCVSLVNLNCSDNVSLSAINVQGCLALNHVVGDNSGYLTLDIHGLPSLTGFQLNAGQTLVTLTSIDAHNCAVLDTLLLTNSNLSSVDLSSCPLLLDVNFTNSKLPVLQVNTILFDLDTEANITTSAGHCALENQTPAAPPDAGPPDGATAKADLIGVWGWTVTTD